MDEKTKKTALKILTIITASCLAAAIIVGVISRFTDVSNVFYYIIGYVALISMLTDTIIRKRRLARFFMVIIYSAFIAALTVFIFFSG